MAERAVYLYSRAAELGDKDALYSMGMLHEEGMHVPKSKYMAGNYYKKASDKGQTDAKVNLALILMKDFANEDDSVDNDTVVRDLGQTGDSAQGSSLVIQKKLIPRSQMHHLRYVQ